MTYAAVPGTPDDELFGDIFLDELPAAVVAACTGLTTSAHRMHR